MVAIASPAHARVRGRGSFRLKLRRSKFALPMSPLGHSLPIRLVSASRDVRSSPKADIRFQRNICRDGPETDIQTAVR
jgi:hypothetical protein